MRPPAGLQAKPLEIPGAKSAALITFPKPRKQLEAYCAIAALDADGWPRYFTLERAGSPSGAIVAELSEDAHRDHGDAGGVGVEGFAARVAELLAMP